MSENQYPIFEVLPDWVLEPEAMGSKEKFWCRSNPDNPPSLFKFPQPGTGQHWAEKVAAEIAAQMDITHAAVELALFQGTRVSLTVICRGRVEPLSRKPDARR